jgi:hypothetical protein
MTFAIVTWAVSITSALIWTDFLARLHQLWSQWVSYKWHYSETRLRKTRLRKFPA